MTNLDQKQIYHKTNTYFHMLSNTNYIKISKNYRELQLTILPQHMQHIVTNCLIKVLHMDCN